MAHCDTMDKILKDIALYQVSYWCYSMETF